MAKEKRKARIETHCEIKVNTGNSEAMRFSKTLSVDVDFDTPADLADKSSKIDALVSKMTRDHAEAGLKSAGRYRCTSREGEDVECDIWGDFSAAQ